jgi:hypothetical protein
VLLLVLLVSLLRRRPREARWAGTALASVLGVWAASMLLTLGLLRGRTVAPGEELAFCGFDCHLHVGVLNVTRGERLGVTLRLRSDARRRRSIRRCSRSPWRAAMAGASRQWRATWVARSRPASRAT